MPKFDKKQFMKNVTFLIDTREQVNDHIVSFLDKCGIKHESRKLDFGDYSFLLGDNDFSKSCVVERKANVDELYNNVMQDRARIEKELYTARNNAQDVTLMLETVADYDELEAYVVPEWQMKRDSQRVVSAIGKPVSATLRAWERGNRYGFKVEFVKDKENTAKRMLQIFYAFAHNYEEQTAARK